MGQFNDFISAGKNDIMLADDIAAAHCMNPDFGFFSFFAIALASSQLQCRNRIPSWATAWKAIKRPNRKINFFILLQSYKNYRSYRGYNGLVVPFNRCNL